MSDTNSKLDRCPGCGASWSCGAGCPIYGVNGSAWRRKVIKFFLDKPALETIDLRFERKSLGASGYDLMANIGMARSIGPGHRWFCNTGLYLSMPHGVEGQVRTRSGLARDHGIIVLNAPGTVDADYRGEVCVTLLNTGTSAYEVLPGDRIAQLVFCPVFPLPVDGFRILEPVRCVDRDQLGDTTRGASGHGSTGR